MSGKTQAERLRAGARAMRAIVGPDAFMVPLFAAALDADADRLDRGEPVTALEEALQMADEFAKDVPDA